MNRFLSALLITCAITRGASAQDVTPVEHLDLGDFTPSVTLSAPSYREDVTVTAEKPPSDRRAGGVGFWTVGGLLGTAMLLDTKSTFDVLNRCTRCYEGNPYVAPFVNRGPKVAFSAGLGFDVGVMAVAASMKRSERFHRIWWVVPIALTAGHVWAYRHNLNVAR